MWEFIKSGGDTLIWAGTVVVTLLGLGAYLRKPLLLLATRWHEAAGHLDLIPGLVESNGRVEKGVTLVSERQRAGMSASISLSLEMDPQGRVVWASRSLLGTLGRSIDDVRGHGWVNCICGDCRDRVLSEWKLALSEERDFQAEMTLCDFHGHDLSMECYAQCLRAENRDVLGYLMSFFKEQSTKAA